MGLLDRVTVEAPQQPSRVYLYAAEKWGKTSFAAYAPKPIFLMTSGETGLLDLINYGQIGPTPHFPDDFKSWPDLLAAVDALAEERHDYQTLVLDTANGAERLLADYVLRVEFEGVMTGKNGYGSYGKGDLACVPYWSEFLRRLDHVRTSRRMSIILLAHSKIKSVNNPEGDDYDQLRPEGIDKLWPLTHKWASVIGAGTYKVVVKDDKANGGRERVIRLRGTAAVVSGNRYGLPEVIPCGGTPAQAWDAFAKELGTAKRAAAKKAGARVGAPAPAAKPDPQPVPEPEPEPEPDQGGTVEPEDENRSDPTPTASGTATPPPAAGAPSNSAPAPDTTEPAPAVEVGVPAHGAEFAAWLEAEDKRVAATKLRKPRGVIAWALELGARYKLNPDFAKWNASAVASCFWYVAVREWMLRTGKTEAQCVAWVNAHLGATYPPNTPIEALMASQLRELATELRNGAKHIDQTAKGA